jgi:uncharacterized protein YqeY
MSLEQKITSDLKEAMKAKDQAKLRSIRAIKAAILLMKTDGTGQEITEEKEIKLIQKLVKQRKESLDIYEKQGREDLAAVEKEEIQVLEKYLPAQMDEAALTDYLKQIVDKLGANSMADMGKIMGVASKELAGKADGKAISTIVKQLLSS